MLERSNKFDFCNKLQKQANKIYIYFQASMSNVNQLNETTQELQLSKVKKYEWDPIEQLQLKVNKADKQDYEQIIKLLTQYLTYPSHEAAELHMESDKLGTRDLRQQIKERAQADKQGAEERSHLQFCQCCGFVKQTQSLKVCTHLGEINNIGISTYLYFQTIKNLCILLVLMSLIYSIYSLATNVAASNILKQTSSSQSTLSYIALSLGSKQLNPTDTNKSYYYIQCWIGLGVVVVWLFMFFILKYYEGEQENRVSDETISAADFTIVLQNAPKDITREQLQAQLTKYQQTITNVPVHLKKPLAISKMCVGKPFYLNQEDFDDKQLDQLRDRQKQLIQKFVQWIQQRQDSQTFSTPKDDRQKIYTQYAQIIKQMTAKYEQIGKKIQQKIKASGTDKSENAQTRTNVFVTFETSHAMRLIASLNDPSIISKLRYYLSCCQGKNKFRFYRGEQNMHIHIQRAPEPEDVIWTNLGVPDREIIKRKLITYTVTIVMLGISFAIVYGLSKAQQSSTGNSILSLAISACISVINVIIAKVIRILAAYEKDYTITKYQTSLALKSILASLINSILIPMIVNYFIKAGGSSAVLYGEDGLASDVFMLGLTNSFLPPILKIIDISYIINRIKKWFASKPNSRLSSNQRLLNDTYEYLEFQVGTQYVYLVSLYLFTCFFVSLQPVIAFFAFGGMGLMYWTQKYSLFNKMKRPVPGTDLVNVAMFQLILCGGFIYSLGSLTWSNFMPQGIPKQALLPNLIALGISLVTIILPYRAIIVLCSNDDNILNHEYAKSRILLASEYDRLNPATSEQAMKQFKQFYEKQLKKFENSSEAEKNKLMEMFAKQGARGQQKRPTMQMDQGNPFGAMFQSGPAFMPPPQMMFMPPPMIPMIPGGGGFAPPPQQIRVQPGFQPPGFQPMNNAFRPMMPMPGPTFLPSNQPQFGFGGFRPPMMQQNSNFGFQQPPQQPGFQQPRMQPGFQQPGFQQPGFQQPGFQQPGFQQPGFQPPQQSYGFGPQPQSQNQNQAYY